MPTIALLLALCAPLVGHAPQNIPEPRREQLLNGLSLLLLHRPGDPQVMLKLRVHSGAAFDLANKEGTMALLSDALFADQTTRNYVTKELGGRLEITTNYDAIDITMTGPAAEFERLAELLRNALINTQLSTEVVGRLRETRLRAATEMASLPVTIADRAIIARLFGTFPYGRTITGTPETLARIDRADLLLARERFLNPNNSTLTYVGGAEPKRVLRALRQFLGVWRRSERVVPPTFRQAEPPDARTLIIDSPAAQEVEIRLAARGVARADRDHAATEVLALLAGDRWRTVPEINQGSVSALSVSHDAYTVGGIFRMSASVNSSTAAAQALGAARTILQSLVTTPPSINEIEGAKQASLAALNSGKDQTEALANAWLDAQTYNFGPTGERALRERAIRSLTPADLQRVAVKLFRDAPVVSLAVGNAAELRAALMPTGPVEVLGTSASPESKTPTSPAKRP